MLRAKSEAWQAQMSRYTQAEKSQYVYDLLKRMRSAEYAFVKLSGPGKSFLRNVLRHVVQGL